MHGREVATTLLARVAGVLGRAIGRSPGNAAAAPGVGLWACGEPRVRFAYAV